MAKKGTGLFVGGLLVGTAVGTAIGVLLAPRSGRETRQILKKSAQALPELAEDLSTTVQLQADRLSESALHNWEGTLGRLQDAIAAGIEAGQIKAKELQHSRDVSLDPSASVDNRL